MACFRLACGATSEAGEPGWHQAVHDISGFIALPFVVTVLSTAGAGAITLAATGVASAHDCYVEDWTTRTCPPGAGWNPGGAGERPG